MIMIIKLKGIKWKTNEGINNSKKESIKHENGSQLFEFRLLY